MAVFIIFYLAIYGSMHAVAYARFRILLPGIWWSKTLVLLFFGLMVLAPMICRMLEFSGHHQAARLTAWVGFVWMGFVFLAFCTSLITWDIQILLWVVRKILPTVNLAVPSRIMAVVALITALLAAGYGVFEARDLTVERVSLTSSKLPPGTKPIKIVLVADIHLGVMTEAEKIRTIAERIREEAPDILAASGDIVDGAGVHSDEPGRLFSEIDPPYGKYAVVGNHEVYAGLKDSVKHLEAWGFKVLRNEGISNGLINVVGVDDRQAGTEINEPALLDSLDNGSYTLLLKHRPVVDEESVGRFDLQLSGHAHGGQIWPFKYITGLVFPRQNGLYDLGHGSRLYTTRGTGTWGPPMRILAPPELTVIEVSPGQD